MEIYCLLSASTCNRKLDYGCARVIDSTISTPDTDRVVLAVYYFREMTNVAYLWRKARTYHSCVGVFFYLFPFFNPSFVYFACLVECGVLLLDLQNTIFYL